MISENSAWPNRLLRFHAFTSIYTGTDHFSHSNVWPPFCVSSFTLFIFTLHSFARLIWASTKIDFGSPNVRLRLRLRLLLRLRLWPRNATLSTSAHSGLDFNCFPIIFIFFFVVICTIIRTIEYGSPCYPPEFMFRVLFADTLPLFFCFFCFHNRHKLNTLIENLFKINLNQFGLFFTFTALCHRIVIVNYSNLN